MPPPRTAVAAPRPRLHPFSGGTGRRARSNKTGLARCHCAPGRPAGLPRARPTAPTVAGDDSDRSARRRPRSVAAARHPRARVRRHAGRRIRRPVVRRARRRRRQGRAAGRRPVARPRAVRVGTRSAGERVVRLLQRRQALSRRRPGRTGRSCGCSPILPPGQTSSCAARRAGDDWITDAMLDAAIEDNPGSIVVDISTYGRQSGDASMSDLLALRARAGCCSSTSTATATPCATAASWRRSMRHATPCWPSSPRCAAGSPTGSVGGSTSRRRPRSRR